MTTQDELLEEQAKWLHTQRGYIAWTKLAERLKDEWRAEARANLQMLQDAGVRLLAEDQTLPDCLEGNRPRAKAFRDIEDAGFVRVVPLLPEKEAKG